MINRRPYIAESFIKPGTAVVQGSADNKVKAPGEAGAGDFIGVYPWEANEAKDAGDPVGIVLHGVVKVLAGENRVVQKLQFLNNNRLKRQNAEHFVRLVQQPTGLLNQSNVAAGKKAVLKADASGSFEALPAAAGKYNTVGLFLEGGSAGDYVDMIVERGSVTIPEA